MRKFFFFLIMMLLRALSWKTTRTAFMRRGRQHPTLMFCIYVMTSLSINYFTNVIKLPLLSKLSASAAPFDSATTVCNNKNNNKKVQLTYEEHTRWHVWQRRTWQTRQPPASASQSLLRCYEQPPASAASHTSSIHLQRKTHSLTTTECAEKHIATTEDALNVAGLYSLAIRTETYYLYVWLSVHACMSKNLWPAKVELAHGYLTRHCQNW